MSGEYQDGTLEVRIRRGMRQYAHWVWRVGVMVVLVFGLTGKVPDGYFAFLKLTVGLSFFFWAWAAHDRGQVTWRNGLLVVAVVFNPLFPVQLHANLWQSVAWASAALALASAWALPSLESLLQEEEEEDEDDEERRDGRQVEW